MEKLVTKPARLELQKCAPPKTKRWKHELLRRRLASLPVTDPIPQREAATVSPPQMERHRKYKYENLDWRKKNTLENGTECCGRSHSHNHLLNHKFTCYAVLALLPQCSLTRYKQTYAHITQERGNNQHYMHGYHCRLADRRNSATPHENKAPTPPEKIKIAEIETGKIYVSGTTREVQAMRTSRKTRRGSSWHFPPLHRRL